MFCAKIHFFTPKKKQALATHLQGPNDVHKCLLKHVYPVAELQYSVSSKSFAAHARQNTTVFT